MKEKRCPVSSPSSIIRCYIVGVPAISKIFSLKGEAVGNLPDDWKVEDASCCLHSSIPENASKFDRL